MSIQTKIYRQSGQLPDLPEGSLFHSRRLFLIYEATAGYTPLMAVAFDNGRPVGKLLAVVRRSQRILPPSFIRRCEVYGTGEYFDDRKEEIFTCMLERLTQEALHNAFLIEFRNLDDAIFGYKIFRKNRYFPMNWLRVRNSLHRSNQPTVYINPNRLRQIRKGLSKGATITAATTPDEVARFAKMLAKNYSTHIRRHFPDFRFFHAITQNSQQPEAARIFIVKYHGKIIGGSVCLFSNDNAYLLFSGGLRKTYAQLYPGILAVWAALDYAHAHGYRHLEFMDAGLPFKESGYRNFILRFGGKQSSTRRWFRLRWSFFNKICERIYV